MIGFVLTDCLWILTKQFLCLPSISEKSTRTIFLRINHKFIKQKDHTKYLGVIIDSHLNFKKHIHQLSKKISRSIGILAKLGHYISVAVLKQRYFSLIYPFFIYGAIISSNTYLTTFQPLIVLQKKIVRIITLFLNILIILVRYLKI